VFIDFHVTDGSAVDLAELQNLSEGIRQTQRLMDMPYSELNSTGFLGEAKALVERLNATPGLLAKVKIKVISG
jgi:hypothetical protein